MSTVLLAIGHAWILLVAALVLLLLLEVLAGRRRVAQPAGCDAPPPAYVVLMPAHDEAGTIGETVLAVRSELPAAARLLVVADNCSDTTAAEARAAGAEVVERHDPLLRGKGHALAFGVEHLRSAPPEVVLVLDADCLPAAGALDLLAARAAATGRPVQALYLMAAPPRSPLHVRMAAFAWAMKNQVRPAGLHALGLPCQLMGSGMAFPWPCIAAIGLGSGHLTEDLELGVRLAAAGHPPCFCPEARVDSSFPGDRAALRAQRRRWEHGHLSMIATGMPLLLRRAVRGGGGAIALAFDLCIPPLALLALMVLVSCGVGAWMASGGAVAAAAIAALSLLAFALAVLLAWSRAGRLWVSLPELVAAPAYVLRKLPVYAGFVLRRQREWVRTSRQR